jgi:hypothetical protein
MQLWKMLGTSECWSITNKENGQPVISLKRELVEQIKIHHWMNERYRFGVTN